MFQTKFVAEIKTHILCSITYFSPENRSVYEIIWTNMVEPDRPHKNIIRGMRIARWITKATNTHSEYVILIAFSAATIFTRISLSVKLICTFHLLFD